MFQMQEPWKNGYDSVVTQSAALIFRIEMNQNSRASRKAYKTVKKGQENHLRGGRQGDYDFGCDSEIQGSASDNNTAQWV